MEKLFAYGSIKDNSVQNRIINRVCKTSKDILPGYTRKKIKIEESTYALAVKSKGKFIRGEILVVTKTELKKFDEYETSAYERKKVALKSGVLAWVYLDRTTSLQ